LLLNGYTSQKLNQHSAGLIFACAHYKILVKKKEMNWILLNDEQQLADIKEKSKNRPQVIFKHSTRCSISSMAKTRLDKASSPTDVDFYFLDLIQYRKISNQIADMFSVPHQSPQVLVIKDGKSVYDESHSGIRMDDILEEAAV
jgi:bacillithiol system protein YtxJ